MNPNMPALLTALAERGRCESDAFAFWLGLDPRETNPWNVEGAFEMFPAFREAVKSTGIRVTGRSLEGFTYLTPGK